MSISTSIRKQHSQANAIVAQLSTVCIHVNGLLRVWPGLLKKCPMLVRLFIHSCLLAILAIFLFRATSGISRFIHKERCLFYVPSFLQNAFVPPYNCTLCQGLTEVPWIFANETDRYRHWISRKEVPLVIRGAYERAVSFAPLTWASLREMYFQGGSEGFHENVSDSSDRSNESRGAATSFTTCQFFAYNTEFTSLRQALDMTKERMSRHFYIGWSNCEPLVSERLRRIYRVPDLLPADSERSALEWFFVGNRGKGAHLHLDRLDKPSWQAQLGGVKRWTFCALPECYRTCQQISADLHPGD
ncbi:uncharacterized protein LOC111273265 isoform X2 [Varroa jacobsoni]|nr:uncharacterized protein LOC111273265 isoform X2 [Varroa jacobsoni]